MGKVVSFEALEGQPVGGGATKAPITGPEAREMQAELIRLAPGASLADALPAGSDGYLFALTGAVQIEDGDSAHALPQDGFAGLEGGHGYTLTNAGDQAAVLIRVLAPAPGGRAGLAGLSGVSVATAAGREVVHVPEQKKKRIYFAGKSAGGTERGHAMIVMYERDTVTDMHQHPNADSLFVMLDGRVRFTVNGADHELERGQAAYFPAGDRHGLRAAPGTERASFLEFHIPGAFTTIKG